MDFLQGPNQPLCPTLHEDTGPQPAAPHDVGGDSRPEEVGSHGDAPQEGHPAGGVHHHGAAVSEGHLQQVLTPPPGHRCTTGQDWQDGLAHGPGHSGAGHLARMQE